MADNILVIERRKRLRAVSIRGIVGETDRLHVEIVATRASCAHAATSSVVALLRERTAQAMISIVRRMRLRGRGCYGEQGRERWNALRSRRGTSCRSERPAM
ncbi:hypothetical protein [Bradyrhizobium sp. Bra64]|nr:hypothetical protein [Bradyrhizobium sp. Bra64]